MRIILLAISSIILLSCQSKTTNPLEKVLESNHPNIKRVMDSVNQYEIQILFSEIIREKDSTYFKDYDYQLDDSSYFYPASTIKFPMAVMALEELDKFPLVNRDTKFLIETDSITTSVAIEVEKIFAVSDNEASNRLYEFIGKETLNQKLNSRGLKSQIRHRLAASNSGDLKMKSMKFFTPDSTFKIEERIAVSSVALSLKNLEKGKGYIYGDSLVNKPMDFSYKNYFPLSSLHGLMKRLVLPEVFTKEEQLSISKENREFLLNTMKKTPKELGYDSKEYYDGYVKFLVWGDTEESLPADIDIYGKVGLAYGHLTDCAYIINKKTNKEYIITATMLVNKNGIYNDGEYEYDSIGIPFLAQIGRELVEFDSDLKR